MARRSFIRDGDQLVPRVLFEPTDLKYRPDVCKVCHGSGELVENIDEERYDVVVPCWACQRFCKPCNKYFPKKGHECPTK